MSIIKHVTLQKIVAHDFRYDPLTYTSTPSPKQHLGRAGRLMCGKGMNPALKKGGADE